MAKISWNPGHGWSSISNVRGGWYGGDGANPQPNWNTPSASSEPLGRQPQAGDTIAYSFTDPRWTVEKLNEIGLTVEDGVVISL